MPSLLKQPRNTCSGLLAAALTVPRPHSLLRPSRAAALGARSVALWQGTWRAPGCVLDSSAMQPHAVGTGGGIVPAWD